MSAATDTPLPDFRKKVADVKADLLPDELERWGPILDCVVEQQLLLHQMMALLDRKIASQRARQQARA